MSTKAPNPLDSYKFPTHGLKPQLDDSSKSPLVLVACGSFSPITLLHLRIFEMAADFVKLSTDFELIGAYISPVSDAYKKNGLAKAEHRLRMCEGVLTHEAPNWVMVDPWEAIQDVYQPTTEVLDHFKSALNNNGPVPSNATKPVIVVLLAGADLIQTMSDPSIWTHEELEHILGQYLTFVVERAGTEMKDALAYLKKWENSIYIIPQIVQNTVSSSLVRLSIKHGLSIKYLVPESVLVYIEEHGLYKDVIIAPNPAIDSKILETRIVDRH